MVQTQVEADGYEEKRDLLDDIEDPHELYDDEPINDTPVEELDLKLLNQAFAQLFENTHLKHAKHKQNGVLLDVDPLSVLIRF